MIWPMGMTGKMNRKLLSALIVLLLCIDVAWAQSGLPEKAADHLRRGIEAIETARSPDGFEQAVREFEDAARLAPDSPDVHYYLGQTLALVKGQTGRAIKELARYLELAPQAPDARQVRDKIAGLQEIKNMSVRSGSLGFLPVVLPDGVYVKYVYPGARFRLDHRLTRGVKIAAINGIKTVGMGLKEFLAQLDGEPGSVLELDIVRAGKQEHVRTRRPSRKSMQGFRELGEECFDDILAQSTGPLVVVFWSPWCRYCETLSRMMTRMGYGYGDRGRWLSISADEHPDLVERFDIQGLPTTLFFKQGRLVDRLNGGTNQEFASRVAGFLKNRAAP